MKKCILLIFIALLLPVTAAATDITAPEIPDSAEELMPYEPSDFAEGFWYVIGKALEFAVPSLFDSIKLCLCILAVVMLIGLIRCVGSGNLPPITLCAVVMISCLMLKSTNSMIHNASNTVKELSDYGKLLLPVMTAALAAQGGGGMAAALFAGTALFDTALSTAISKLLIPGVYIFLAIAVTGCATGNESVQRLKTLIHTVVSKGLRIILYIFTGYLTVTGVVAGTADQIGIKAAKLTISGMVPVVGNIMAEASETLLVSAGLLKSAAGVYGLLAVLAIGAVPFLQTGIRYLLLKATAALSAMFDEKQVTALVSDFGSAMGLLLAMTLTQCMLILISTICFMKGMG